MVFPELHYFGEIDYRQEIERLLKNAVMTYQYQEKHPYLEGYIGGLNRALEVLEKTNEKIKNAQKILNIEEE